MRALHAVHRWLGLLTLGQVSVWFLSGLIMSSLPMSQVRGDDTRAPLTPNPIEWNRVAAWPREVASGAEEVTLRMLGERPVFEIRGRNPALLDAATGQTVQVDALLARRIAQADQKGAAPVAEIERLDNPTVEYREKPVPAWAVRFDDERSTTVYLDAQSGRITARRNNAWRTFDFMWGIHIMDWRNRNDFSTLLLSAFAAAALAMAISGGAIWVRRLFSPEDSRRGVLNDKMS